MTVYDVNYQLEKSNPKNTAENFMHCKVDLLYLQNELADLKIKNMIQTLAGTHVRFHQHIDNIPVYTAEIVVSINKNNTADLVKSLLSNTYI